MLQTVPTLVAMPHCWMKSVMCILKCHVTWQKVSCFCTRNIVNSAVHFKVSTTYQAAEDVQDEAFQAKRHNLNQ